MRYAIVLLTLLVACSQVQEKHIDYNMPTDYEIQTYTIDHSADSDAYNVQVAVISQERETADAFEQWQNWRDIVESEDKLRMMNAVRESENKPFSVREEQRIEEYCKEYGYEHCMDIDRTCEEDGCHRVMVLCDDDNYNEELDDYAECRKFDVEVGEDIDDELTKAVEDEVECNG